MGQGPWARVQPPLSRKISRAKNHICSYIFHMAVRRLFRYKKSRKSDPLNREFFGSFWGRLGGVWGSFWVVFGGRLGIVLG